MFTCVIFVNPGFTVLSPNHPQKIFNSVFVRSQVSFFRWDCAHFEWLKSVLINIFLPCFTMHKEKQFNYQPSQVVLFSASQTALEGFCIQSSERRPQKTPPNLLTLVYYSVFYCISFFEILYLRPFFHVSNTLAWRPAACRIHGCYPSR